MNARIITPAASSCAVRKVVKAQKGTFAGKPLSTSFSQRVTLRKVHTFASGEEPVEFKTLESTPKAEEDESLPSLQEGIQSQSAFTGLGYMDGDSAGQSNIFSVEPKMYVASEENAEVGAGSNTFSIAATTLAVVVLVAGGFAVSQGGAPVVDDGFSAVGEPLSVLFEEISGNKLQL
eukprot:CAMPEP_0118920850 /NCGR_PEP_ID=MMETSP1169-20130426/281_1 /TAXON_ID=36882 /ORGANISM="Pyramimonas obovata, Strain CCMP722" /LENGTH=176 /DNA_ID=CAMNT_0006861457 /DNA_START=62 /DNA_END=592 /DNA_ORIENTATION=-